MDMNFIQTCLEEMLQTGTAVNQIRRHLHMTQFKWRAVNPNVNSVSHSLSPQTHLSHTAAASHLSLSSPPPLFSQQSPIDGKSLWGRIDDDHMQQLPISANWSMNVLTHLEQDYSWVCWSWSDWQIWQSKTSLSLSIAIYFWVWILDSFVCCSTMKSLAKELQRHCKNSYS